MSSKLEKFYDSWSEKTEVGLKHDITCGEEKALRIITGLQLEQYNLKNVLDYGCGYGIALKTMQEHLKLGTSIGIDFSKQSIKFAKSNYVDPSLSFETLDEINLQKNILEIRQILNNANIQKLDAILLIDLLEHVPRSTSLIKELSQFTKYFIIKLPVENSIFDNYIINKFYPGSNHPDGHVREFTANSVYHYIRSLGLTPLAESLYAYNIKESFPPLFGKQPLLTRIKYFALKMFKLIFKCTLPTKIFLRTIGGGGYYCIAEFNEEYILE